MRKFILLLCHDRSGSNLMRSILTQHPDIYIVPPLPLYERLFPIIDRYGDLEDDRSYDALLADMVALAEVNHFPLAHPVALEDLRREAAARPRSLGQACQACFETIVRQSGRPCGGLKSAVQSDKLEIFLRDTNFSHAVFQYRDPRDVCLSTVKAARRNLVPSKFMSEWLKWHRNAREVLHDALPGAVQEVRYEDLLLEPEATLDSLWEALGLRPSPNALAFHEGEEQQMAASASYMWENLNKPLISSNFEKYYDEWNEAAIRDLEDALGEGLEEFGYAPALPERFKSTDVAPKPRDLSEKDKSLTVEVDRVYQAICDRLASDVGAA